MTLKPPNEDVLRALANLDGKPDFETVLKYLRDLRDEGRAGTDGQRDKVLLRWAQGSNQTLDHLVTISETARETLTRQRERRK